MISTILVAGIAFVEGVKEAGLEIADKSAVISSSFRAAVAIRDGFAKAGIKVKAKKTAADLGIDRGSVRWAKPKHTKRKQSAAKRVVKIKKIAKASVKTGGLSLIFSTQAPSLRRGMAPTSLAQRRRL